MPKRNNWPTGQQPTETHPGELAEKLRNLDALRRMPPIDCKDPQAVQARIDHYFEFCDRHELRPGVEGLALAVGVRRETIWKWSHEPGPRGDAARHAYALLAALMEEWTLSGRLNPVSGIFLMKNNFGYHDSQQLELSRADMQQMPTETAAQIAERYREFEQIEAPPEPPKID